MADNKLRLSTQRELEQTLEQLEEVWDNIGISKEQRDDRIKHFYGHVVTLCEKILEDEHALKNRIISRIDRNTRDILRICEELHIEPEEPVDGLMLLELDEVLQERLTKLESTRDERKEALRQLQIKDEALCEVLGETPYYMSPGLVPSPSDLKVVQEHINAMEDQKIEREATYHNLKNGVLNFLALLEHSPDDSFTQELICASGQDDIQLTKTYLHQLRGVHSDLEFRVHENESRSLALREEVASLWVLLDVPYTHQQAFLSTAPNHTPSNIAKVEEELERLRVLRTQNLETFMIRVREEVEIWWDKCYVDENIRDTLNQLYEGEATEDSLSAYEAEINRWKTYHTENAEILSVFTNFLNLYKHMLELEDRAKDPSRLFNTRGGALLQEEKAKKKVKNELPRMEERLREMAGEWLSKKGQEFEVYGVPVMQYIDELWNSHDQRREVEKNKRQQAKEGKKGGVMPSVAASAMTPNIKTPAPMPTPNAARKRVRELDEPTSTKKARPGGVLLRKSPSKGLLQKSPLKTPRGKPLSDYNSVLPQPPTHHPVTSSSIESSLHSTISYDKFEDKLRSSSECLNSTTLDQVPNTEAWLGTKYGDEIIHSSFMDCKESHNIPVQKSPVLKTPVQKTAVDYSREKHLRDTLHLASPSKATRNIRNITGVKCNAPKFFSPRPSSTVKPSLRRTTSQPCLVTSQNSFYPRFYGNPRFFRNREHPLRFLI